MKSLAEFIMRSRAQAMFVAALCTLSMLLFWVSAAVVGLVVLRFGLSAASSVILAALLPGVGWALLAGEIGPLTSVICVSLLAATLRATRQWSAVLTMLPMLVSTWCMALLVFAPEYVQQLLQQIQQMYDQVVINLQQQQSLKQGAEPMPELTVPTARQFIGAFGLMQVMVCLSALMLARWWQALLYNPGGFQQEFHSLRLSKLHVVVLVAGLLILSNSADYSFWSFLFAVPLIVAGVALVHGLAGLFNMGKQWLLVFYLLLFIIQPMTPFLMMMAIADSALDFRSRYTKPEV